MFAAHANFWFGSLDTSLIAQAGLEERDRHCVAVILGYLRP